MKGEGTNPLPLDGGELEWGGTPVAHFTLTKPANLVLKEESQRLLNTATLKEQYDQQLQG